MRITALLVSVTVVLMGSQAWAQSKADKSGDGQATPAQRKDPKGIQGVSPYMELLVKGNRAYVARDFAAAISAYQEAVQLEPQRPQAHYLLGEAYLADGKLEDAGLRWDTALRYADKEPVMRAKVLFVLADLRERQQRWNDAAEAWKQYESFVTATAEAKGYAATATERNRAIAVHKDLADKYAKVQERIRQREQDTQERK